MCDPSSSDITASRFVHEQRDDMPYIIDDHAGSLNLADAALVRASKPITRDDLQLVCWMMV